MITLPFDTNRPHHQKQNLSRERLLDILREAHWGTLATVMADGEPYCVPVGFALDETDGSLIFHTARRGVKLDNIQRDPRVCFSVVGRTELITGKFSAGFESAVVFGCMAEITDDEELYRAAVLFCRKFAPEIVAGMDTEAAELEINDMAQMVAKAREYMTMYRLTPKHVSGKQRHMAPEKE